MKASTADDIALVRERMVHARLGLKPGQAPEDHPPGEGVIEEVEALADSMGADGTWPDLDYTDQAITVQWQPWRHLKRLRRLAAAWARAGSAACRKPELEQALHAGLDHWLEADYKNPNWWHNRVGVPLDLSDVALVSEATLSDEQIARASGIIRRGLDRTGATGQNMVWSCSIQTALGCILRDEALIREALLRMGREIAFAMPRQEGIHADFSYYMHGECLYSGGYGQNFSRDCAQFAYYAHGTQFAWDQEKRELLAAYILEGQQWMIRGRIFDYGAIGRQICRPGESALGVAQAAEWMAAVDVGRADEFLALARRIRGEAAPGNSIQGNRHFWKSDMTTHHRPGWYASVRMISNRLDNTDFVVTDENRRSCHIADGTTFIMRRDDEYEDIFPVWDWRRVPGTTVEHRDEPWDPRLVRTRGIAGNTGGASDGACSMSSMWFLKWGVMAHKAWAFFDDAAACLGSRIACSGEAPVLTSVNQCRLRGPVKCGNAEGPAEEVTGARELAGPCWVHHDGIGYLFPDAAPVKLQAAVQRGSWTDIGAGPEGLVEKEVFSLWFDHGIRPENAAYRYFVVPNVSAQETAALFRDPPVQVLRNDSVQAVRHAASGRVHVSFFEPGEVEWEGGRSLRVEKSCCLLYAPKGEGATITAANPHNLPQTIRGSVAGHLVGEGSDYDAAAHRTRFAIELPGGEDAGSSVAIKLRQG
jgi:chondroitin AC lyase